MDEWLQYLFSLDTAIPSGFSGCTLALASTFLFSTHFQVWQLYVPFKINHPWISHCYSAEMPSKADYHTIQTSLF